MVKLKVFTPLLVLWVFAFISSLMIPDMNAIVAWWHFPYMITALSALVYSMAWAWGKEQ